MVDLDHPVLLATTQTLLDMHPTIQLRLEKNFVPTEDLPIQPHYRNQVLHWWHLSVRRVDEHGAVWIASDFELATSDREPTPVQALLHLIHEVSIYSPLTFHQLRERFGSNSFGRNSWFSLQKQATALILSVSPPVYKELAALLIGQEGQHE